MPAFELALRQGADGIELDVHLTSERVPVVIHDARLERTTSGTGWISDHSLKALRRLDAGSWFNRRYPAKARPGYAGRKVPVLREVLAWAGKRKCLALVEIKKAGAAYPGIEAIVLEEIHRAGAAPLTTVISFDLATLQRIRKIDPRISLGIDFTRPLLAVRRARSLKAVAVLPHWAFASRRFLRRAHDARLRVIVWNVNQPRWMLRKLSDGVDGIITDYPARLAQIRRSLQESRPDSGS